MTERETIEALQEKVQALEGLLEKVLGEKAVLARITSEPFEHEGLTYYRTSEPGICFYDGNRLFEKEDGKKKKKQEVLKPGTEVMIIKGWIVQIVPEPLFAKEEKKNEFKRINWNEVGGLGSQIERIKQAIELPLKNQKLAEKFGIRPIKGLLLYGPPGCGKTLIARAIASMILNESSNDESFIYIKGAELLSMYVGATEQRIIQIFQQARTYGKATGKRAVVFIDEAEAILPRRGSRVSSDVDKTIVPTFLSEMDGFDDHSPIMILSTNLPDSIDQAILRPGRIDIKIEVGRPTFEDVEDIFKIHLSKVLCYDQVEEIARQGATLVFRDDSSKKNRSGAMVETMVAQAAQKALGRAINQPKTKIQGICVDDLELADSV